MSVRSLLPTNASSQLEKSPEPNALTDEAEDLQSVRRSERLALRKRFDEADATGSELNTIEDLSFMQALAKLGSMIEELRKENSELRDASHRSERSAPLKTNEVNAAATRLPSLQPLAPSRAANSNLGSASGISMSSSKSSLPSEEIISSLRKELDEARKLTSTSADENRCLKDKMALLEGEMKALKGCKEERDTLKRDVNALREQLVEAERRARELEEPVAPVRELSRSLSQMRILEPTRAFLATPDPASEEEPMLFLAKKRKVNDGGEEKIWKSDAFCVDPSITVSQEGLDLVTGPVTPPNRLDPQIASASAERFLQNLRLELDGARTSEPSSDSAHVSQIEGKQTRPRIVVGSPEPPSEGDSTDSMRVTSTKKRKFEDGMTNVSGNRRTPSRRNRDNKGVRPVPLSLGNKDVLDPEGSTDRPHFTPSKSSLKTKPPNKESPASGTARRSSRRGLFKGDFKKIKPSKLKDYPAA